MKEILLHQEMTGSEVLAHKIPKGTTVNLRAEVTVSEEDSELVLETVLFWDEGQASDRP